MNIYDFKNYFTMYGFSLVPFPVTLVEGLRKIEGRTAQMLFTLLLKMLLMPPETNQAIAKSPLKPIGDKDHQLSPVAFSCKYVVVFCNPNAYPAYASSSAVIKPTFEFILFSSPLHFKLGPVPPAPPLVLINLCVAP